MLGAEREVRRRDGHDERVGVELERSGVKPEPGAETRFSGEPRLTRAVPSAVREVSPVLNVSKTRPPSH